MKKLIFLVPCLISAMMWLISCSQDEDIEIIGDPPLGYVETVGDLSWDGETFFFTIRELPRIYDPITERWDSLDTERYNFAFGKQVRITNPSQSDSMIQRKLMENVDMPVQLLCIVESFWGAIDRPEYQTINVKSVSEINDNTRSMQQAEGADYFYPDPPAWFFEPKSREE